MSLVLLFALDDLRARHGGRVPAGSDPRHDTAPFRAFRATLLPALASVAAGEATLAIWWEGGFNGYALAVSVTPGEAVPGAAIAAEVACPVEAERPGSPRPGAHPLGTVRQGSFEVATDADGATFEAPFGAATGHFGAPGMRRILP